MQTPHSLAKERRSRLGSAACLMALWAAGVLTLACVWVLCLPGRALAYVDPSVMTYTIQALAGVAVALSAVAGVAFRRVRRRLFKALGIDENANKAVEYAVERIDPASEHGRLELAKADDDAMELVAKSEADAEKRGLAGLSWPKRFAFALLMSLFAFFIVLIAPALEIFGANAESLVFGIDNVWWITVVINGALAVLLAFALSAIRGRAFMAALLLVFCIGLAAYVQAFFMNSGMMPADGGFINWNDKYFVDKKVFSGVVWTLILIVPQLLSWKHRYTWLRATSAVAVVIVIMQGVGVASVAIEANNGTIAQHERPYVTQGSLYDVHPESNVVTFVLDTYDTRILEELLEEDPGVLAEFTDFIYYRNSAGVMIPTQNAIPYMLTGIAPEPGEDLGDYRSSRYGRSRLIPGIHESGYSIDVFTDSAMLDYGNPDDFNITSFVGNIHKMANAPIDVWNTYLVMDQCALYREAPWVAKPMFWYYTTDVNNRMVGEGAGEDGHDEIYELDDAGILRTLREQGLSITDDTTEGPNGAFKFIHLFGPHFPFNVDENGEDVGVGNSDQTRQAKGSLKVVDQYLAELKKLGLYDSATIIVTADHGVWDEREHPVRNPISPIMLAKPRVPEGQGGAPCKVSDAPVSHSDLFPTIMEAIGQDPAPYGSGIPLWSVDDPGRPRYFDALTSEGEGGRRFVEYLIDGDVVELESWSQTGNEWPGA